MLLGQCECGVGRRQVVPRIHMSVGVALVGPVAATTLPLWAAPGQYEAHNLLLSRTQHKVDRSRHTEMIFEYLCPAHAVHIQGYFIRQRVSDASPGLAVRREFTAHSQSFVADHTQGIARVRCLDGPTVELSVDLLTDPAPFTRLHLSRAGEAESNSSFLLFAAGISQPHFKYGSRKHGVDHIAR